MMRTLPNDEQGRYWVQTQWIKKPTREQSIFATLAIANENDEFLILGNAFIIRDNGDSAICLGAAHSFEKAKQLQCMRTARGYFNVPQDFREKGPRYLEPNQIHAFFVIDGEPIVCRINQLNYIENYDVAVFTVHAPEARKIFTSRIAIDLGAPQPGEEIAILANDMTVKRLGDGKGILRQRFELRLGVVTEVIMGPSAVPGQSFYFRTTIPVTPGMSGAPVINKPIAGQTTIARGVVSTDLSDADSFNNFLIPGNSAASMLWPAMGLGLTVEIPPDPKKHAFLADMLNKKLLDDRSNSVRVQVWQPVDKTEILYVDERTHPPTKVLLSTTGHPNANY